MLQLGFRIGRAKALPSIWRGLATPQPLLQSIRLNSSQAAHKHLDDGVPASDTLVRSIPVSVERELPDPFKKKKQNRRYFWAYAVGTTLSCVLIFNYEKTRSPIVNSVLYCLRRSEHAKAALGPNIGFASSWPWIWGTLNTVKGNIDITFQVKGDTGGGNLHLNATRLSKLVPFDIHAWTLETDSGEVIDLAKDASVDFEL
ncbi:uncharacterized protein CXQ87_001256 [Candidozyma duobushaemuli]|uniref:Cytochrome c oxidase assembly factor 1 n=1 Tax=Candidozyma duobushaemuli TaxID=1231522 RepID=A0A2V1AM66_9ASCO|nr:uncharacterized protein CXQ87_001256 [[Candida] duobushaemulonis]PVH18333.1 hypothetical protein CXQ87_001256 [[Candida] duobushaemulonis]